MLAVAEFVERQELIDATLDALLAADNQDVHHVLLRRQVVLTPTFNKGVDLAARRRPQALAGGTVRAAHFRQRSAQ